MKLLKITLLSIFSSVLLFSANIEDDIFNTGVSVESILAETEEDKKTEDILNQGVSIKMILADKEELERIRKEQELKNSVSNATMQKEKFEKLAKKCFKESKNKEEYQKCEDYEKEARSWELKELSKSKKTKMLEKLDQKITQQEERLVYMNKLKECLQTARDLDDVKDCQKIK